MSGFGHVLVRFWSGFGRVLSGFIFSGFDRVRLGFGQVLLSFVDFGQVMSVLGRVLVRFCQVLSCCALLGDLVLCCINIYIVCMSHAYRMWLYV